NPRAPSLVRRAPESGTGVSLVRCAHAGNLGNPLVARRRSTDNALDRLDHVIDGEAELFECHFARGGGAEGGHADDFAVQADVFAPVVDGAGFDGDAGAAVAGEDAFAVFVGLFVERFGAG